MAQFAPAARQDYRFQDDKVPAVAAFPADPQFNYVGPLPDGALGNRGPERKLAATFGQLTSTGKEPQFTTLPLAAPMTIGGAGELRAFLQGPSEAVAGLLQADLIDVDDKGGVATSSAPARRTWRPRRRRPRRPRPGCRSPSPTPTRFRPATASA